MNNIVKAQQLLGFYRRYITEDMRADNPTCLALRWHTQSKAVHRAHDGMVISYCHQVGITKGISHHRTHIGVGFPFPNIERLPKNKGYVNVHRAAFVQWAIRELEEYLGYV